MTFQVWSGRTFTLISTIRGEPRPINCIVYHPLKEFVVTGGWGGNIVIWDLVKLEKRAVLHGGSFKGIRKLESIDQNIHFTKFYNHEHEK